jgi:poly(A) polymerase
MSGKPTNNFRDITSSLSDFYKKRPVYLVGGTIRDILLERETKDYDLFVVGNGVEFARQFQREIGGRFILLDEARDEARVVIGNLIFDFNGGIDIESDLARRDFTINSMAMKLPSSRIIDPFGGRADLRRGIIKTTREENLSNDALRILRAFRFKSLYGFSIERKTRYAIGRFAYLLKDIAKERIKTEVFFILEAETSWHALKEMAYMGVLCEIIPGFSSLKGIPQNKPYGDLVHHSINTVRALEELEMNLLPHPEIYSEYYKNNKAILKLSCLLHDIGKPQTFEFTGGRVHFYGHEKVGVDIVKSGLRLSNEEMSIITTLIRYHMRPHLLASDAHYTGRAVVRLVSVCGRNAPGLLLLALSDALASAGCIGDGLLRVVRDATEVMTKKEKMRERLITGDDLIALGLTPGPIFGKILAMVEEERELGNLRTKEEAISYIKRRWL